MKLEMLQNRRKKWFFRLVGSNGRIIMHSESYASRSSAKRSLMAVYLVMQDIPVYINDAEAVFVI